MKAQGLKPHTGIVPSSSSTVMDIDSVSSSAGGKSSKNGKINSRVIKKDFTLIKLYKKPIGGLDYTILSPRTETSDMGAAEVEQKQVDRFWGKDKEQIDCSKEWELMDHEYSLSASLEKYLKQIELQRKWEDDYRQTLENNVYENATKEVIERKAYLNAIFSSTSIESICQYKWSDQKQIKIINNASSDEKSAVELLPIHTAPPSLLRSSTLDNIIPLNNHALSTLPKPSRCNVSIHLDGVQQTKALEMDLKGKKQTLGPILRSRSTSSHVEQYMNSKSLADGSSNPELHTKNKDNRASNSAFNNTNCIKSKKSVELLQNLNGKVPDTKLHHMDMWDGHSAFKWDQDLILSTVFKKLSKSKDCSEMCIDEFLELSKNADLIELLKFTVFGALVKTNSFNQLLKLLHVQSLPSTTATDTTNDTYSIITFDVWMKAAKSISVERSVQPKHIRLDDEQFEIARLEMCDDAEKSRRPQGWYAQQARKEHFKYERGAYIARKVQVGDVVWGLHNNGCCWLPATIIQINHSDDDAVTSYDLRYLMTVTDIVNTRILANNRQYTVLPSDKKINSYLFSSMSITTERSICSYAFDVIDADSAGKLDIDNLFIALQSNEMRAVIKASTCLFMLVYNKLPSAHINPVDSISFSHALRQMCATSGVVTKNQFVEYCLYVGDLHYYNQFLLK